MNKIKLNTIVWKEGEKYISQCLDVEVSSFGNTKQEALHNLEEALELYFENNSGPIQQITEPSLSSVVINNA